jgi:sigma-B regulation protein RsbU (phosphoserine phosphatase)
VRSESSTLLPLIEFSQIVNSSLDLSFILNTVLRTLMGKMLVAKGMVLLRQQDKSLMVVATKGLAEQALGELLRVERLPRAIQPIDDLANKKIPWAQFLSLHQLVLLVPILSQKNVVGYIALGERLTKAQYSSDEKKLIQLLVNLSGAAIQKGIIIEQVNEANKNLDRKNQELNTLFDLSKEFNIGLDSAKVVRLITFALLGQVGVKQYAICLRNNDDMQIVAHKLPAVEEFHEILKNLCELEHPYSVHDLLKSKRYRLTAAELAKHKITAVVPMHLQQQTKGMMLLGERMRGGEYTQQDFEFLYSLGNLAIISIENARLFHDAIEKQRMEDELNIAREIQQGLLPETLPAIQGYDVAAINIPSLQVGGDYYDVVEKSEHEFAIAIGDVSGKGAPAALLMANVQASLRALTPTCVSVAQTTGYINNLICANTRSGSKFITFFWGILDVVTRQFRYSNAGHNPPYLLRADGSVEMLDKGGLILGIFRTDSPYEEGIVTLNSGDTLVMYTDGISEAMNAKSEEFTEERLQSVLQKSVQHTAKEIIKDVQSAVNAHTQGTPQSDDITIVVVKAL